jgi:hypothetical protein
LGREGTLFDTPKNVKGLVILGRVVYKAGSGMYSFGCTEKNMVHDIFSRYK